MNKPQRYSVIIPVYKNESTLPSLIQRISNDRWLNKKSIEFIFVVDGSPDDSLQILRKILPLSKFEWKLLVHSRNFGAFAAIRTGMIHASGNYLSVMAADLQEPPELLPELFKPLTDGEYDIAVGVREARKDPIVSKFLSTSFWSLYRNFVNPEVPKGGVDIFACTEEVSKQICNLKESNSSLIGLIYWIGYRRKEVGYIRAERTSGKSSWSLNKKFKYLNDSIYSFTDLPMKILTWIGGSGGLLTSIVGVYLLGSYVRGDIKEPGYTPLMLLVLFSTFMILTAIGVVGNYVWRAYENTKGRPEAIVRFSWNSIED